ncbi:MAG: pyridoxal 5'-phosphate synthase lyase subunit PdxS [Acidimicrobiales bacterium]
MDVVNPEQAKIAEDAGAVAVMALERVPADIRRDGGISRMSDPVMIEGIIAATTIPVMAKARIGHFVEAQILQQLGVDYVDESEVLPRPTRPTTSTSSCSRWLFVCGATNLGEALRRISEGVHDSSAGEAGTGNIVAVRHLRSILSDIRKITGRRGRSSSSGPSNHSAHRSRWCRKSPRTGKLHGPVVLRRWHRHPRRRRHGHAAWCAESVCWSGIFKSDDPAPRARAIVEATTTSTIPRCWPVGLCAALRNDRHWHDEINVHFAERGW